MKKLTLFCLMLFATFFCKGQNLPQLTSQERQTAVDSFAVLLEKFYVFPDKGNEMAKILKTNLKKGNYNKITDPVKFADQITQDLQAYSKDKHLRAIFDPERVKEMRRARRPDDEQPSERMLNSMKQGNYAFKEVKILDGNIGYLRLDGFVEASLGGETATAALNFLANTNALIIDLRENGGGSPSMIQLISSYFFEEPTHLNSFYFRPENTTTQSWTLPYVSGKRMLKTPIYVLTSNRTFSAAEEFTYNLKNLKRATIVGETTGGGAHPGGTRPATDNFALWVPVGRAINPITNTNWEGVGVIPDVKTEKSKALDQAYIIALEGVAKNNTDETAKKKAQWQIDVAKAQLNPVSVSPEKMKMYEGVYENRTVSLENGTLYYQRAGRPKFKMYAITADTFGLEGLSYFRLRFVVENNQTKAIEGLYDDGNKDTTPRNVK